MDFYDLLLAKKLGGGGSSVTVKELNVTKNGTYTAEEGKAYSPVKVNTPELVTVTLTIKNTRSDDPLRIYPWACTLYKTDGTNITTSGDLTIPPLNEVTIKRVLPINEGYEYGQIDALALVNGAVVNIALDNTVNCYLDVASIIIDDPTKPSSCDIIYSAV